MAPHWGDESRRRYWIIQEGPGKSKAGQNNREGDAKKKSQEMHSCLEPPKEKTPCWHPDFIPWGLGLDFWALETFVVIQLLSRVWLPSTPWNTARQASLSFTVSQSLLKLMSIDFVMPYNHLVLCHPPFSSCPQSFPASRSFPMSRHWWHQVAKQLVF